jgi:methyl-galactoside transport system ATP-binding protein/inositol transport system ATP-binding protein
VNADQSYLLRMDTITKEFPGVKALEEVNFYVKKGEVHALLGENGAGKSTLMKCLIGMYQPTSGKIYFEQKALVNHDTRKALEIGISMIHQELNPVLEQSVMENIWLGREPRNSFGFVDHKKMAKMTEELLERIGVHLNPKTKVKELTVATIQMLEIAKAISYNAKLIIMDEPTSSLTEKETTKLFEIIHQLKEEGRSVVFISHKLDEIYAVCNAVTILRDGKSIGTKPLEETSAQMLIQDMVGRELTQLYPKKQDRREKEVKLKVSHLTDTAHFRNVSFELKKGEILGFAGLIGAGRSEVMEAIFGLRELIAGKIELDGQEIHIRHANDAIAKGMAFLTEDRRKTGLFPMLSVGYNIVSSSIGNYRNKLGLLNHKKINKDAQRYIDALKIKTPSPNTEIQYLSGGNQQKALIARWLLTNPDILILDEPTRGIDIGAKSEIHQMVADLASEGKSILLVSSELPEVLGLADRVVVMHEGKVQGILENNNLSQELVMEYASGERDDYPEEGMEEVQTA